LGFGARCERALAAAVFDCLLVLLLRRTAEAALAAFADVFRLWGTGDLQVVLR
jgi:hypothetical protein